MKLGPSFNSWWSEGDSNPRHGDFQSPALPTELPDQMPWITKAACYSTMLPALVNTYHSAKATTNAKHCFPSSKHWSVSDASFSTKERAACEDECSMRKALCARRPRSRTLCAEQTCARGSEQAMGSCRLARRTRAHRPDRCRKPCRPVPWAELYVSAWVRVRTNRARTSSGAQRHVTARKRIRYLDEDARILCG